MTEVYLIHGAYGNPNNNWFPWLRTELEQRGVQVIAPRFPTPVNQSLDSWRNAFKKYLPHLDSDTILIGHSLGTAFIIDILEHSEKPIKAAYFVAGFLGNLGNPNFDDINYTFTEKKFNWEKIRKNCPQFYVFASDNDPYVPMEKAEELVKLLGAKGMIIPSAGHFNAASGFRRFDQLLDKVLLNLKLPVKWDKHLTNLSAKKK